MFSGNAINATFYDKLDFDFIRDIAPVASIARSPFVMEVHPSVPAKTVPEFIAYAKANPGKVRMASNGNGTTAHVTGELFKLMTGVDMVHVPYRGPEPALADLLAGKAQVRFGIPLESMEHIKTGGLSVLAVTTAARSEMLPNIPTAAEFVPGYEASAFFGIGAPKNAPAETIQMLNKVINEVLADPEMKARIADMCDTVLSGSPADFGKLIADETEKWGKVVKFVGSGLTADGARYSVMSVSQNRSAHAACNVRVAFHVYDLVLVHSRYVWNQSSIAESTNDPRHGRMIALLLPG
jgi:tripartite-type tricarboxylate transporter receptor subunit TctC